MNFGSGASIIRFPEEGIIVSPSTLRVSFTSKVLSLVKKRVDIFFYFRMKVWKCWVFHLHQVTMQTLPEHNILFLDFIKPRAPTLEEELLCMETAIVLTALTSPKNVGKRFELTINFSKCLRTLKHFQVASRCYT